MTVAGATGAARDDFEPRRFTDADGYQLNYRLYKPRGYDPAKKYPLVVFLHGAGERGSDNLAQVRDALYFASDQVQSSWPCFVLAPQCPLQRPAFQLYGTTPLYEQSYNTYADSVGQWRTYRIALSKLPLGPKTHLLLINKPDPANGGSGACSFRRLMIGEEGEAPKSLGVLSAKFDLKQGSGKITLSPQGGTVVLLGDISAKAPLPYTVTPRSYLSFEFHSSAQGAAHAIGLDTDAQFDYRWVQVDWSGTGHTMPKAPSMPMRLTMQVVAELKNEFSLDPQRYYLTGISMGGYGTWDLLAREPGLFAAAVPVCGGGDQSTVARFKHVPIWAFHGAADKTVLPLRSRNMIDALKAAGAEPKYTEYPHVAHNCWDKAYSDMEMMRWLFAQKRRAE